MTVPETKERGGPKGMDVLGRVLVTVGLLGIVFALIEGNRYGWVAPIAEFRVGSWTWPSDSVSIVLFSALAGVLAIVGLLALEGRRGRFRELRTAAAALRRRIMPP